MANPLYCPLSAPTVRKAGQRYTASALAAVGFGADTWDGHDLIPHRPQPCQRTVMAVLAELGIDISDHTSKTAVTFRNTPLDLVVTVCDDAAENCPLWLGQGAVVHISFPDPATATGTDEEKTAVFRQIRDDIREQVLGYLERLED